MYSYDEITASMMDRFTSVAGYSPDDASDIGIRMKVLAGEIYSICSAIDWLKMQTFPQSAQGEQLDLRAQERGLMRKKPLVASGNIDFKRSAKLWYDVMIPCGTVCSTDGENPIRYITTKEAILKSGKLSVTVPARAEQGGRSGNTQPHTITVMITPPPAIESISNSSAFIDGEDKESDSEIRSRLMKNYASISNGTNSAFYRECALKYDGVYSVGVVPREKGVGTIGIYLGGRGGAPSASVIAKVQSELNHLREINVDVVVAAAKTVAINIEVYVTPADNVETKEANAASKQAIKDYFNELAAGEPFIVTALGVQILSTGKVKNYVFSQSVTIDRKIKANQIAVCGKVEIGYYTEILA